MTNDSATYALRYIRGTTTLNIINQFMKIFGQYGKSFNLYYPPHRSLPTSLIVNVTGSGDRIVSNESWIVCNSGELEIYSGEEFHIRFKIDNIMENISDTETDIVVSTYIITRRDPATAPIKESQTSRGEITAMRYIKDETTLNIINQFMGRFKDFQSSWCIPNNKLLICMRNHEDREVYNGEWIVCFHGRLEIYGDHDFNIRFKMDASVSEFMNDVDKIRPTSYIISLRKGESKPSKKPTSNKVHAMKFVYGQTTLDHVNTFINKMGKYVKGSHNATKSTLADTSIIINMGLDKFTVRNHDWIVYKSGMFSAMSENDFNQSFQIDEANKDLLLEVNPDCIDSRLLVSTYIPG